MNKRIVIIGASGHGKVVANIAKLNDYNEILFLDDDESKTMCGLYPVVGTSKSLLEFIERDYECIVAIGNNKIRKNIFDKLVEQGAKIATLIHPSAVIDETVAISKGTAVMANVVINASTTVGKACIVNTASTVDHDCIIEDYVHISPGVNIAGTVIVGSESWMGIGVKVSNNIKINNNCIVGAGSVVIKDIQDEGIYVGVPIKKIKQGG